MYISILASLTPTVPFLSLTPSLFSLLAHSLTHSDSPFPPPSPLPLSLSLVPFLNIILPLPL